MLIQLFSKRARGILVPVIVFILSFVSNEVRAQGDVPSSSSGCEFLKVAPIKYSPPLRSDMPLECLQGFAYFDSICRTIPADVYDPLAKFTKKQLRTLLRYISAMREYDPILFYEYQVRDSLRSEYSIGPGSIVGDVLGKLSDSLGTHDRELTLARTSMILHVRVAEIHDDSDIHAPVPVSPLPLKCVRVKILDAIKGSLGAGKINGVDEEGFIDFLFSPVWERSPRTGDVIFRREGSPPCNDCMGDADLEVGREYVVFLDPMIYGVTPETSFYQYWPVILPELDGGIIPIIKGSVSDNTRYFGLGKRVKLAPFKAALRRLVKKIGR